MKTNTIRHKIVGDTTIDEDTELHGMIAGTVTVASEAGVGTTFTVDLPRATGPATT